MIRRRRKVVHYSYFFGQLTENWIYNQIAGLDRRILTKFYAFARKNRDSFRFDNLRCLQDDLNYFTLFFNRTWNVFFHRYPHLLSWLREDRPDLIHAHFGPPGYSILPYAGLLDIPLITSFYGLDAYLLPQRAPSWQNRYRRLFDRGRLFLAEGPAMQKKLIEIGCPPEKVVVHHIGIKLENYEFRVRKPDKQIRLLACGRFVEKKGIPYAVAALSRFKRNINLKVHLTIVGDSDEKSTLTPEKRRILDSIKTYDIADAVTIRGYVPHDELLKIAYDHHILLAPSVHAADGDAEGGFPVILTEVLATGMPTVGFSHCDIPEIIQDGKSGFLVPERDVDALAERLTYLIEHPEIWSEMGRAGRAFVEANYDIDKLNDQLVDIYESLIGEKAIASETEGNYR